MYRLERERKNVLIPYSLVSMCWCFSVSIGEKADNFSHSLYVDVVYEQQESKIREFLYCHYNHVRSIHEANMPLCSFVDQPVKLSREHKTSRNIRVFECLQMQTSSDLLVLKLKSVNEQTLNETDRNRILFCKRKVYISTF